MLSKFCNSILSKHESDWKLILAKSIFGKYDVSFIESQNNNYVFLRLMKSNNDGLFGTKFLESKTYVGGIDLILHDSENPDNFIKTKSGISIIEYMMINDVDFANNHNSMYGPPLNNTETNEVKKGLFDFAEKVSRAEKCKSIQMDVHENLRRYKKDIEPCGFKLSDKRADHNPFWIKSFKELY